MVSYMKSGLATSLSIAGVLLAGGSALALNSSVLQNSSTVRGTPALAATVSATGADTANGGITALGNTDAAVAAQTPSVQAKGVADVIVDPTTTVADMTVMSDTFRARVEGVVYGAVLVRITPVGDDTYETTLSLDRRIVNDLRSLYIAQLSTKRY